MDPVERAGRVPAGPRSGRPAPYQRRRSLSCVKCRHAVPVRTAHRPSGSRHHCPVAGKSGLLCEPCGCPDPARGSRGRHRFRPPERPWRFIRNT